MDRQSRIQIAKVLRAAATALEGAGYGSPMDPVVIMQQINRQRRNWAPLVNYRTQDIFGNKQTFTVFLDGGRLKYTLRSGWGDSGIPLSFSYLSEGIEDVLPKTVDQFPSVAAMSNRILGLLKKRRIKVSKVEQLEELD